jgi:hypothetical protein
VSSHGKDALLRRKLLRGAKIKKIHAFTKMPSAAKRKTIRHKPQFFDF